MLEFGIVKGLAQSGQYDQRINDLRYKEQADKRAKSEAEARAKLFAEDMDYNNAMNEFDAPIIKELALNKIREIASFVRENPDYTYNPDKLAVVNSMKKELKSNADLNRGLASDMERKKFLADYGEVAKNPNFYDTEAYEDIKNQWENYRMYGNQNGKEAAEKFGKQAFVYQKPRDFIDLAPSLQKMGNQTKNYDIVKPGGIGEWYSKMNPLELESLADAAIQQNERQIDVETRRLGLNDPAQKENGLKNK